MTAAHLHLEGDRRKGGFLMPEDHTIIQLYSGDCYVTNKPKHMIVTILGSCVSACIRDPIANVGGMNHFLLPNTTAAMDGSSCESARYGAFAMEQLINGILKLGGMKSRLEVKLFGGGNVMESSMPIGERNVAFALEYLTNEGLSIAGSDLGGDYPRRIHYYPDSGKVMMRSLMRREDMRVVEEEKRFASTLVKKQIEGGVDLF